MRRYLAAVLLLSAVVAHLHAVTPAEARTRLLKGNYEEAQSDYEELLKDKDDKHLVAATVGLSEAHHALGEYDKALSVVETALKKKPKAPDLLARQGAVLHYRGRYAPALAAAEAGLAAKPLHLGCTWVKAQVLRDRGEIKLAEAEMRRIVRIYSDAVDTPNEIKDPESLLIVGLASAENARWNGIADEFQTILKDLYGDALKADKNFWPAEYAAGLLLLEKYNRADALDALDKALTINPSAAEALTARGIAALQRFEIKDAESFAERALKVNPNLPDALRLMADLHAMTSDHEKVLKEMETARKVNPRDERTLARIAAAYAMSGRKKEADEVTAEVEKNSAKPGVYWFDLGERFEERRRYDLAEEAYKKALAARPELAGPLNALGLLYMRVGKEKEAAEILEKAWTADKFNVRVSNMRKVIKHLENYKEKKTAHFVIRYDEKSDGALAEYLAVFLEEIYDELAKKFDYKPAGPFPIEIFRTHDMFSGRTVALPDLHTIGACTGRVVTMVSPNEKNSAGEAARRPFNWARVMRHEVVHIFNLAQTNYLVPHWYTEGLAVSNEGSVRPPSWNAMMRERVPAGNLLNLDTIDLGFIRPRDPMQWQQAYCQAQLYVEYLEKTYGEKVLGELLAAFAKGKTTTQAIEEVCKTKKADFEKGYVEYLQAWVKSMQGKKPVAKRRTLEQLRAEYKKNPRDAEVAGELSLRLLNSGRKAEARKIAEGALEDKKNQPKALYVLAQLAKAAADEKQERIYLERALDRDDPDFVVLKALAKAYYDGGEFNRAADILEIGRKADPYDKDYLVELSRVYARLENTKALTGVLEELVPLDADDLDRRVRLAKTFGDSGDHAKAEKYARQAIEIDITSKEAREALLKALRAQKKDAEAERLAGVFGKKAP